MVLDIGSIRVTFALEFASLDTIRVHDPERYPDQCREVLQYIE
ncbi:MAG TPA: hypothetical protein VN372_04765 [Methanospirillum sp.]|nr:hypothetical protein [Methanospirillum sp.]